MSSASSAVSADANNHNKTNKKDTIPENQTFNGDCRKNDMQGDTVSSAAPPAAAAVGVCPPTTPPTDDVVLQLVAAWSKAGVGTSLVLEIPQSNVRIALDMGATPCFGEAISAGVVLMSHGHVDHMGAMVSHARAHAMTRGGSKSTTPTYFVPQPLVAPMQAVQQSMSLLDGICHRKDDDADATGARRSKSHVDMNFVGLQHGDIVELPIPRKKLPSHVQSLLVHAFEVDHGGHPALGFVLIARQKVEGSGGLKLEYRHLSGMEIGTLVRSGVQVKEAQLWEDVAQVTYTGDTTRWGLQKAPFPLAWQSHWFICEMTFLENDDSSKEPTKAKVSTTQMALDRGHLHVSDVAEWLLPHWWNAAAAKDAQTTREDAAPSSRRLLLVHLSDRHAPSQRALDLLLEKLPPPLLPDTWVAIASLLGGGAHQHLMDQTGCISLWEYQEWKKQQQDEKNATPLTESK